MSTQTVFGRIRYREVRHMARKPDDTPRSVIITFKRKDKRARKADKQELLRTATGTEVQFLTARDLAGTSGMRAATETVDMVGYDVNRYEAPILMARLTGTQIEALRKDKDVARVEEDGLMHALPMRREETPDTSAETIPIGVSQVKAPDAWPTSQAEGIKVFICDTGIDSDHPDLVANLRQGKSFVETESSTEDFHGHGTHCAGTVAAAMNGQGVVGVAPFAYVYPVKVLASDGSGNWSWLIAGLDWIMSRRGARIASMSLGGPGAPAALGDMCEAAYNDGVLLVAAAGNTGPGDDTVGFPAKYPHVVAVSAVDSSDIIASFSSRGPEVEVCAPGVNVLSTMRGGGYGQMSGTSMACPHVSGVSALAWGSHRSANNKQIRWLLGRYADKVGDLDPAKYGAGRVNANTTAFHIGAVPERAP
jgi:subtilisin